MSGLIGIPPAPPPAPETSAKNPAGKTTPGGPEVPLVRDINQNEFAAVVVEGSAERPVIVDFWADWCGPCKTLAPLLEKIVTEFGGAVTLAKVDTGANQELTAQLRIRSLPTVYAFFQGRPVDGFQGALPESEIRAFVEKLIAETGAKPPGEDDGGEGAALEQAQALLAAGEAGQAEALAGQMIEAFGVNPAIALLLCKALSAQNKDAGLEDFLDSLDDALKNDPELKTFVAGLALRKDGEGLGALEDLTKAATGGDLHARFDLARKLLSLGEREKGADVLIAMFREDRDWQGGAAKQKLLEIFSVYGNADPFTLATRRKFTAVLYS